MKTGRSGVEIRVNGEVAVTTAEAARMLGVTKGRVRQFVVRKRLRPLALVPGLLLCRAEVESFPRRPPGRPRKEQPRG